MFVTIITITVQLRGEKKFSRTGLDFSPSFCSFHSGIFSALGLPVTQCPLGLDTKGLPLGIQVVATPFNDHLTLAVAQYLEKTFGGWVCPGKL